MDYKQKIEGKNRYSFNISYQGTDENCGTHSEFQDFCKPFDNVYIAGMRALLDYYKNGTNYGVMMEALTGLINEQEERINAIEAQVHALSLAIDTKEDRTVMGKTFGKQE